MALDQIWLREVHEVLDTNVFRHAPSRGVLPDCVPVLHTGLPCASLSGCCLYACNLPNMSPQGCTTLRPSPTTANEETTSPLLARLWRIRIEGLHGSPLQWHTAEWGWNEPARFKSLAPYAVRGGADPGGSYQRSLCGKIRPPKTLACQKRFPQRGTGKPHNTFWGPTGVETPTHCRRNKSPAHFMVLIACQYPFRKRKRYWE